MKKLIYLILFLLIFKIGAAQNLISNGDFEQFISCPNDISQFEGYATDWMNPMVGQSYGTPDYFNQCATSFVDVPSNVRGWQNPHSGNAYCGIVTARENSNTNYREYLEIPLLSTLQSDKCYHFQMYISLANTSQYTSDALGVYFSDTAITGITNFNPLPFTAQINNTTGNFPDSLNWTLVEGNYLATGTENYMLVGNFKDHSLTTTVQVIPDMTNYTFIYIDDISLVLTTCVHSDVNAIVNEKNITCFPNPVTDRLQLTSSQNELSEINIYDISDRLIKREHFSGSASINMTDVCKGLYIYEVRCHEKMIGAGKIVKE